MDSDREYSCSDGQKTSLLHEGGKPPVVTMPPPYSGMPPTEVAVRGPGGQSRPRDPSLNTIYLSIFAMLFCCWPCGLVGLIYGIQAMQEYYRGQYEESTHTEKKAKSWVIASIVVGVVTVVSVITLSIVVQAVIYGVVFTTSQEE